MAKFIIKKAYKGYYFVLLLKNGQVVLQSEIKPMKYQVEALIEDAKTFAPVALVEDETEER